MVNNTALELKTTRESASRRRGITRGLVAYFVKTTELRANLTEKVFSRDLRKPRQYCGMKELLHLGRGAPVARNCGRRFAALIKYEFFR